MADEPIGISRLDSFAGLMEDWDNFQQNS
jgi:hypothetical protein